MAREFINRLLAQNVSVAPLLGATSVEDEYVIPDTRVLRIAKFTSGYEYTTREARVELILRGGTDAIIGVGYGTVSPQLLGIDVVGDGEKSIVIRLVNGDNGILHMFGRWEGYLL